jgi:hypothetical protein|nr:MAG TPA: DNA polymerase II small subunit [Caudoviricetes sp.]
MERKENETYISYIKRVTNACSDKKISYSEWGDYILGTDNNYSSENLRKAFYVVYKLLNKIDENNCDYDAIKDLENLRDEIYKERCRLQDIQREKRNDLRVEARFENLLEVVKDNIGFMPTYEIKDFKPINKNQDKKYAVLQLSDWHCGALVDNQFNYYNVDTMVDRATKVRNNALEYCKLHNVTDLVIEINGDMVNGAIHVSSRVESEEGVIQQVITVTDVLAKLINSMKPYFNLIKIITTLGNHGRLTPNKSDSITNENFEMLIPAMLRDKLGDVKIIDSKGLDFTKYEIDGKIIMVSHGQNDSMTKVISDFSKIFKVVPNEIHLGHTHSYTDINDCDIKVTVNGSLIGSDDYAVTIRKVTTPSQNLIVYEKDRCIYEIKAE